jgi:hypothetical protein
MNPTWHIGMSSWIIQDGNYSDFAVGREASFALEFYAEGGLAPAADPVKRAEHLGEATYRVSAEVLHTDRNWWVIDIGLPVFREEAPPSGARAGRFFEGTVNLGIDPFFYMEYLGRPHSAPPLIFTWSIREIFRQTAPFISHPSEQKVLIRDPSKLGWSPIAETDAWHDDDGHAEYILHAEVIDPVPRRAK